ncbi:MAG TPA: MBL fold metallo-hydrolase [Methylomirabilota bacterium]|nr:MBL fold metallo-hydrolase [Methylomirabilota bacterium]
MRTMLVSFAVVTLLLCPAIGHAQDGQATLERAARAMGASTLNSIEFTGSGASFAVGQSPVAGASWPRFNLKSYTRSMNYETGSLRQEQVLSRADPQPRGGGLPAMGEARQTFLLSGEHAWTLAPAGPVPGPRYLAELQLQLWTSPHGVIKAAMANKATVQGRTIAFTVPGKLKARASLDSGNLVQRVEAVFSSPVLGDMPFEVSYADYRDFGGIKFPMRIRQSAGKFPSLDLTVDDVRPNARVDIDVPDPVRQATNPYAKVTTQQVADGIWYLTGGSHHSVVLEMRDHLILVEAPLNDARALAVVAEARKLVPNKPVRYVIASHHHFDHSGGVRAAVGEGATLITHESSRAYFERVLAAPATVSPDHLAKSGRKAKVEGVRDKRMLTDGTRTVEIHHIAGNLHEDGLLMVYLPKEKLLIEADAFSPAPPNAPPPAVVNPNTVNLADNITKLGLSVDQILPIHGRMVPLAELHKTIGRAN